MDTLKSMLVFRAIVETGNLTKAAKKMKLSTSMVSKHLAHLEASIQAQLLNRNSRHQSLTDMGRYYYQQCCDALDIMDSANANVAQETQNPQGSLTVTVPAWFVQPCFAKLITDFCQTYPAIHLSLNLESLNSEQLNDKYDVALHITNTPQDHWIVRPLATIPVDYVASPGYLAQHGTPKNRDALSDHHCLLPNDSHLPTDLMPWVDSNHAAFLVELAKADMGITFAPDWLTRTAVEQGELAKLFPVFDTPYVLYAVYLNRRFLNNNVRCFIDFIADYFAQLSSTPLPERGSFPWQMSASENLRPLQ